MMDSHTWMALWEFLLKEIYPEGPQQERASDKG